MGIQSFPIGGVSADFGRTPGVVYGLRHDALVRRAAARSHSLQASAKVLRLEGGCLEERH